MILVRMNNISQIYMNKIETVIQGELNKHLSKPYFCNTNIWCAIIKIKQMA